MDWSNSSLCQSPVRILGCLIFNIQLGTKVKTRPLSLFPTLFFGRMRAACEQIQLPSNYGCDYSIKSLRDPDSRSNLLFRCEALTCEIWTHRRYNLIQIWAWTWYRRFNISDQSWIISDGNSFACMSLRDSEESMKPIARRLKMESTNPSSSSAVLKDPQGPCMKRKCCWIHAELLLNYSVMLNLSSQILKIKIRLLFRTQFVSSVCARAFLSNQQEETMLFFLKLEDLIKINSPNYFI